MTSPLLGRIDAVLRGQAVDYPHPDGQRRVRSAIAKTPVSGPVVVTVLGLDGDEQGDTHVHGGVDKALHQYPREHYELWRSDLGARAVLDAPGAFGENFSSSGVVEADLCWGDRVRVGSCVLELAQTRQPCWKLNVRFGQSDMAQRLQETGRTGWYWRVLEGGLLQAGDAMHLIARPHPDWPLPRVIDLLYKTPLDASALQDLTRLHLPPSWQRLVQARLDSGAVEDWSRRLWG